MIQNDCHGPLRIGIFSDSMDRSGVFTYTCRLARELSAKGVDTIIFTYRSQDESIATELRASADRVYELNRGTDASAELRAIIAGLRADPVDVFVPNYRRIVYAACPALVVSVISNS